MSNYRWYDTTVRSILQHEVYIGNLVAQRQTHIFKVNKYYERPREEWVIVEDVFEPLVDKELFDRVQDRFEAHTRSCRTTGEPNMFAGLVFCNTCGGRLTFVAERAEKISVASCIKYRKIGRAGCTPHRLYECDLYDAVLNDIREWAKLALEDEQAVLKRIMEQTELSKDAGGEELANRKLLMEKRLVELDRVIAKLYEDYALGKLDAEGMDMILPKYRKEQTEIKKQLSLLAEQSEEQGEAERNAEKWIELIRKYSDLQELNAEVLRELITKIYVGDVRKENGTRVQSIEIHYRFIGNLADEAEETNLNKIPQ